MRLQLAVVVVAAASLFPVSIASQTSTVRLAMVNVPDDVVRPMLATFHAQTGRSAEIVYTGNDPFAHGREGKADLLIAHYGHEGVQPFITAGFGLWPHPVFANTMALVGPPSDPAHIRGLTDGAEALKRIAQTKSPFVVNESAGATYLEQILWTNAGITPSGNWYLKLGVTNAAAVDAAAQRGGYTIFGLPPFLRQRRQRHFALEPLVLDPLFQRIMVSSSSIPPRWPA
jgi:tungstate transport system substrate-binding protein